MRSPLVRWFPMLLLLIGFALDTSSARATPATLDHPLGALMRAASWSAVAAALPPLGQSGRARDVLYDFEIRWLDSVRSPIAVPRSGMLPILDLLVELRSQLYIEVSPQIRLVPLTERLSGVGVHCDF